MEPQASLPRPQQSNTGHCTETAQSSPRPPIILLGRSTLVLLLNLQLNVPSDTVRFSLSFQLWCQGQTLLKFRVSSPAAQQKDGVTNNSKMIGLLSVVSGARRKVSCQGSL
jgi:hypothetical protein